MKNKILCYTLRLNRLFFQKFCYIAEYNNRSINRLLLSLIEESVAEFEKEYGKINLDDGKQKDKR